jgi:ATP-dependent helicase/nuclease subunit A
MCVTRPKESRVPDAAPPDEAARVRIATDLGATLFVEAGAGSGKTRALVERVVALVSSGTVELGALAAITFTEKAGDELRVRIRRELEAIAEDAGAGLARERCRSALDQLDGAAIGTLHSFARRLLTEHPVEAGLPPHIEVLDEVSSNVAFEGRWTAFLDELLAEPAHERDLLLFFAAGPRVQALRALARSFGDNWDLVAERVPETAPDAPSVADLFSEARRLADAVCAAPCQTSSDALRVRLDEIADYVATLAARTDDLDLLEALGPNGVPKAPSFAVTRTGNQENYAGLSSEYPDINAVRAAVAAVGRALADVRTQVAQACAKRLAGAVRAFTLRAAAERQRDGKLEFHDLLVLARYLVCHPDHGAAVRSRLHDRYQRILLDEFQDTDPIQIELAVRIAAAQPDHADAGELPWDDVAVAEGRLFVVGDPKQSIYRFRRADISTFLRAAERFGRNGENLVELTANFRSVAPVIDWVNTAFGALMSEGDAVELPVPSQPRYIGLRPQRDAGPAGPPVSVMGRHRHPKQMRADEVRRLEAEDVAATVVRAVHEGWAVDDGAGGWRPARLGDIAVLVPARTSLPFLEDALERTGIAFRAESSSLVYASRPVRDLVMVLRAVDDPTNYLHVVSALRTPLLGCGDDDLFRFKVQRRGHWGYLGDQPDTVPDDDPVARGLGYLRALYDRRQFEAPSVLLDRIARDRRAFELGFVAGRPRDVWRRLRFVIDQARAWSEATGGNLRQYVHWVTQQASENIGVAEAILPETDDDAVRIMTIHSAKGLQFPITIVSGMSTRPQHRRAPAEVVFPPGGGVGYRFSPNVYTDEFTAFAPIDEQMGLHERIRLLYVACTRARDHLVVSLHRCERGKPSAAAGRTSAELLVEGMGDVLEALPDAAVPGRLEPAAPSPPPPPPPFLEWEASRDAALGAAARPRAVSATALTDEGAPDQDGELEGAPDPGLRKRPRDLDLPPWLRGRYGTALGRAVHGVLQTVDLATGEGLDAAVAAQCEAEAVPQHADEVAQRVRAALASPTVAEAAACAHWRELYVCAPVDGRLLEGYIDLLYRGAHGLMVVDHKTSASADPDELDRRVVGYRNQGAAYALAVEAATGEAVAGVTFLFLTPQGAFARDLDDLAGAVEHVRQLVATGGAITVP